MKPGSVPQHPPTKLAPASTRAGRHAANCSAVVSYTTSPRTTFGIPALGLIQTGRSVAAARRAADGDVLLHAVAAVGAHDVDAPGGEVAGGLLGIDAHHRAVLVAAGVEDHAADHRQPGGECGLHGQPRLGEVGHGLHHYGVGAGLGLRVGLLGEGGRELILGDVAEEELLAARPDGGEDPRLARRSALRDLHAGAVDLGDTFGIGVLAERDPVGAEGVGEDHPAAGLHVGVGHLLDAVGVKEVPRVGGLPEGEPALLQLGPPRTVGEDRPARHEVVDQLPSGHVHHSTEARYLRHRQ